MPDESSAVAATLTLRLVYLARFRDTFALGDETLSTPVARATVAAVIESLRARGSPWSDELAHGRAYRVAVNHTLATTDTILRDGDEVAFLPPVTGG